ncbi:MAG TPA: STAS domain-containing protein [Solirubrobacterales bacterium]|nr:STAS domain-containing protein [Solirubrobacterales bacterium]
MPDTTTEIHEGPLVLRQIQEPGRVRLALHGELDLTNAATVEAVLDAALASGDEVLVDLAKLEFLDSTGIALLVAALKGQDAKRISFLPSESTGVTRLLSLTGLDKRLDFNGSGRHASRPAA